MKKRFLDEATIIEDSFRLGAQVFESGLRPTFIVGLWRGGSSVGIYVQECLQTLGVETDHISLRTSYRGLPDYQNMIEAPDSIRVHGTRYLIDNLNAEDSLLIVDDAFSSGHSIDAVKKRLKQTLKRNYPDRVRSASLWYRPKLGRTSAIPDYYIHTTNDWLVFPYELKGLTLDEINSSKPLVVPHLRKD